MDTCVGDGRTRTLGSFPGYFEIFQVLIETQETALYFFNKFVFRLFFYQEGGGGPCVGGGWY